MEGSSVGMINAGCEYCTRDVTLAHSTEEIQVFIDSLAGATAVGHRSVSAIRY